MKIGIIGSGIVGRTLGTAFIQEGHEVMLGTRNEKKEELEKWRADNPKGRTGSFQGTAEFGELLVLATGGAVTPEAIQLAGAMNFNNKIVIDTTNPIASVPPDNGVLKFFTNLDESLMEKIQRLIPGAKVVKAFNSVGNALMYRPQVSGGQPTMFICGNDAKAKETVAVLLREFGWDVEDMGGVQSARAIEPLCILWCIPGFLRNQWDHAFKLVRSSAG